VFARCAERNALVTAFDQDARRFYGAGPCQQRCRLMLNSRSRLPWRIGLFLLLSLSCLFAVYGWARSSGDDASDVRGTAEVAPGGSRSDGAIDVRGKAELVKVLRGAKTGITVSLAPGNYGSVNLDGVGTGLKAGEHITITSADPCNRATFARLWITNSANLVLRDLRFENAAFFDRPAEKTLRPDGLVQYMDLLRTDNSSSLAITNNIFAGSTVEVSTAHPLNGFPHGIGWKGENVSDVVFQANTMSNLFKGLSLRNAQALDITHNVITDYRSDAVFLWDVADVTIEDNRFTYPRPAMLEKGKGDHPDFIQIKNVDGGLIQNNYMIVGPSAGASQGIFPGPARKLTVRNNIIISRMLNGIHFREIAESEIANNLVLRAEDLPGGLTGMDGKSLPNVSPRIRIKQGSSDLILRGNAVSGDPRGRRRGRADDVAVNQLNESQPFVRMGSDAQAAAERGGYRRIGDILFSEDSLATAGIDADKFAFLDGPGSGADARCPATT